MKSIYRKIFFAYCLLTMGYLQAQVPNGGMETWTNGSPNSWYCTNVPTLVTNITQESPGNTGIAAKGEVIMYSGSPYSPLLSSVDMSFNGFPISQSYTNFSFYYKLNITGTARFEASITFYDAMGNWVASGGNFLTGTVSSYTLATFPMNYGSANAPVEAVIIFAIQDTVATDPPVGNYFIVDDITLSGIASVNEQAGGINFAQSFPSPASDLVTITHSDAVNGKTEITVYDLLGNVAKNFFAESTGARFEHKFSVADLPAGIYPVRITSGKKQWLTKIVKEK
jgi:hypothetical protein